MTQLNIETLWSGGPFDDPVRSCVPCFFLTSDHSRRQSYNGGNKQPVELASTAQLMQTIRETIFQSPTGDINSRICFNLLRVLELLIDIQISRVCPPPREHMVSLVTRLIREQLNLHSPGSFAASGYLVSNINATGSVSHYKRWLDLDQGLARTSWTQGGTSYRR